MSKILYIHGFGTTGKHSHKGKLLAEYFGDRRVLRPDIPFNPLDAVGFLRKIIENEDIALIVASSLGGFYALSLAKNLYQGKIVFINPSFMPDISLSRLVGEEIELPDGSKHLIDDKYIKQLRGVQMFMTYDKLNEKNFYFYLANDDELLDHRAIPALFPNALMKFYDNEGHGFKNFKDILPEIEEIFKSNKKI